MPITKNLNATPINLPSEMIRQILGGKKTQFRIPFADQPPKLYDHLSRTHIAKYAPMQPGDIVWVRETWAIPPDQHADEEYVIYKATDTEWIDNPWCKWQSPLTMPEWASRLYLNITDTRAQRVQEITCEDAIAEGLKVARDTSVMGEFAELWNHHNEASGNEWATNPWVWAYTFRIYMRQLNPGEAKPRLV